MKVMKGLTVVRWLVVVGLVVLVVGLLPPFGYGVLTNVMAGSGHDQTDLIMVFPGTPDRITTGYRLAREGRARRLAISGVGERGLAARAHQLAGVADVACIATAKSRTTFEDAFNARAVVQQHKIRSVLLVTSSWHLLRSSLLLHGILLGTGVEIVAVSADEPGSTALSGARIGYLVKMAVNEAVKLWGSLAELGWEAMTGELLMDKPAYQKVSTFVKSELLFR